MYARLQGRTGTDFDDLNESLLGEVCAGHPDLVSLEMETFHLLDLARCSRGEVHSFPTSNLTGTIAAVYGYVSPSLQAL